MRLLVIAAVAMGMLIVGGTAALIALVAARGPGAPAPGAAAAGAAAAGAVTLDEPSGTRIAGAAGTAEALVLRLSGGGPDRVVVLDARSGQVLGRARLAR